jgi:putative transposase
MLLRLAYLDITNAFALLRPLPGSDRDTDAEILALRHQLAVLHRQQPRPNLHRLRLLVRPDTILRWHGDLHDHRHATVSRRRRRAGPARSVRSARKCCIWRRRTRRGGVPAGAQKTAHGVVSGV